MEIITYDTIRNVHRTEKSQIALQKLPDNFFLLAKTWLEQKQAIARKDTLALLEIENAKRLLEDIVNIRERKIVIAALHTVRGGLPPENMTQQEEKFFDELVDIFKKFKQNIREQIVGFDAVVEDKINSVKEILKSASAEKALETKEIKHETEGRTAAENQAVQAGEKVKYTDEKTEESVRIKIISELPKFIGSDLKDYGPYRTGDSTELPQQLAQILISRGVAEKI